MIGLMGNGRLLYENPPGTLLRQTGSRLLADAVLQVYQRYESEDSNYYCRSLEQGESAGGKSDSTLNHNCDSTEPKTSAKMMYAKKDSLNLNDESSAKISGSVQNVKTLPQPPASRTIASLLKRNFIQMMRNPWYLSFLLILPAVQVLAAVVAIGGHPRHLNVGAVVNEFESSSISVLNSCPEKFYSCRYLKLIPDSDVRVHFYQSEEKAIEATKQTEIAAFITFPENFTAHMKDRILFNNFAENSTLDGSQIELRRDMTDTLVALRLTQVLMETLQKFILTIFDSPDNDPRLGMLPLNFSDPIYGSKDISHQSYIAAGIIVSGTMERTLVAGVTKSLVLSGELITQAVILTVQTALMYVIVVALSDVKMQGSFLLSFLLAYLNGILGVALGFALPLICKREVEALLLACGLILPDVVIGGLCWPMEFKAGWITYLSYGLPHTFGGIAMRSIMNRGWGFTHSSVTVRLGMHLFLLAISAQLVSSQQENPGHDSSVSEPVPLASSVLKYNREDFRKYVPTATRHHYIHFYAPWCSECKNVERLWAELAFNMHPKPDGEIIIAKVDCTIEIDLCTELYIPEFPTVKFFKRGGDPLGIPYRGKVHLPSMEQFLIDNIG
ncbi:ABC transporter G family member 20, partial [Orchesella cincta]